MIARAIGLALLTLTGGAAVAAPAPVYREIRDFVVACDNLRSCVVRWAREDGDGGFEAYLAVSRDGGPDGGVRVMLSELEGGRPDGRSLKLDGRAVGRDLRWRDDAEAGGVVADGAAALALVRALAEGTVLTYADEKDTRTVTLNGLKAALLAVDEAQRRLGTTGAFVRRGAAADAGVPAPPPLPVVVARRADPALKAPAGFAAKVRRAQAKMLGASICDPEHTDGDEAWPLNRGEVLVSLGCMMHAYQSSMVLLRAPRDAPEKAQVVVMPPAAGDTPPEADDRGFYVEGEWDPDTATFFEAYKGRGLADCGGSSSWAFDGTAFRLASANRLRRCSGGPPGDWPTVFRSKVEVR